MRHLMALLALLAVSTAAVADSNIDPAHKLTWGENIGWLNWRDANSGEAGVVVGTTFLSGFVWGENVGWISVGDGSPAAGPRYANTDASDCGVNIEDDGDLSGLAWGENIGWINFSTSSLDDDRARYDACTGAFAGYAWGENVGWINLDGLRRHIADCNANGIADECDLVGGTSQDCNTNGIPDECDISSGSSGDCNANAIPDDCELIAGNQLPRLIHRYPFNTDGSDSVGGVNAVLHQHANIAGSAMDQDLDTTVGQDPDDTYDAAFSVLAPGDPLWSGLQAYWKFDDGSGDTAADCVGSNHGTLTGYGGTPGWTSGKIGGALEFDGLNDCVRIPSPSIPLGDAPRTIAGWISPDESRTHVPLCYGQRVTHQLNALSIWGTNPYFASHNDDLGTSSSVTLGAWNHYAMTYDGATVRLYLNASPIGAKAIPLDTTLYDAGLLIGAHVETPGNYNYFSFFDGKIDEVGIWGRALSQPEIQQVYNNGAGRSADTAPLVITGHLPAGMVSSVGDHLDVTFNKTVKPGSFTADDVSVAGPGGAIIATGVSNTSGNTWRITFPEQAAPGVYRFHIGPQVSGFDNREMDQDLDLTPVESPDDVHHATLIASPASEKPLLMVSDHTPQGVLSSANDHVDVTFNKPIAPDTFTAEDVLITGPGGSITPTEVVNLSGNTWRISFPSQSAQGVYHVRVGPQISGLYANAVVLDGNDDYVELPIGTSFPDLTSMTIEAWVLSTAPGGWERIFDGGAGEVRYMFLTPNGPGGRLRFAIKDGFVSGDEQILEATSAFPSGALTHVAVTRDGPSHTGVLYINGVAAATNPDMTLNPADFGPASILWLGKSTFPQDPYFRGSISEFRVYDTALSATEVASNFAAGPDPVVGNDCDNDGLLDECEPDCNNNHIPDDCDIAGGGSNDCNTNSIPDECDLASATSRDCNSNGVPDECDIAAHTSQDCNENAVPDECDIPPVGSISDLNSDGVPDDCQVVNVTRNTAHSSIPAAVAAATGGDRLLAGAQRFILDTVIDLEGKPVILASRTGIDQPATGVLTMADGAELEAGAGQNIGLGGQSVIKPGDRVDLSANQFAVTATGNLRVNVAGLLDVAASSAELAGQTRVDSAATATFTGSLTQQGTFSLLGGTLAANPALTNTGTLSGFGTISTNVVNRAQIIVIADTQMVGDCTNNGTTTVQNGMLTVTGSLVNNGQIIGNVAGGKTMTVDGEELSPPPEMLGGGKGLAVLGDYTAGPDAYLVMPGAELTAKIAGAFNVAIEDASRYDMVQATIQAIGLVGSLQAIETMSRDVGPAMLGLDRNHPGNYPIGTLRVGPTPTTISLIDAHDNDGQGQDPPEAIYVRNLLIDSGATVNTNGLKVYYLTMTNRGTVDQPDRLIPIVEVFVPPDLDRDGDVDAADFSLFEACALGPAIPHTGTPLCQTADFDGDQDVDQADFGIFQRCYSGEDNSADPDCAG